jgi:hypothetical protein
MGAADRIQDLQSRIGALNFALEQALSRLAELYGRDAALDVEQRSPSLSVTVLGADLDHGLLDLGTDLGTCLELPSTFAGLSRDEGGCCPTSSLALRRVKSSTGRGPAFRAAFPAL